MGIKDLNKFLRKYSPGCLINKKISDYANKTIAIDTSLIIYKSAENVFKNYENDFFSHEKSNKRVYILNLINLRSGKLRLSYCLMCWSIDAFL